MILSCAIDGPGLEGGGGGHEDWCLNDSGSGKGD